jgi:aminoglycoside phosphotransferase family enzyme
MSGPRYKALLRTLYGAVITSRLPASDLRALSEELRRGRLSDELAYMIDRALEHLGGSGDHEALDGRITEAERLIRSRRIPKAALISLMESLGTAPSSPRETINELLARFMAEASPSRVNKLMDLLEMQHITDEFLSGIGEARK